MAPRQPPQAGGGGGGCPRLARGGLRLQARLWSARGSCRGSSAAQELHGKQFLFQPRYVGIHRQLRCLADSCALEGAWNPAAEGAQGSFWCRR